MAANPQHNEQSNSLHHHNSSLAQSKPSRTMDISTSPTITQWNEHLIKVGVSQDRRAFKALFDHFGPLIKSYFMAKFPSQHSLQMMDELVQEVMIKVWQKATTFDSSKAAASTWIFTLARNTRIDMLRRQNKYANTFSLEVEDIWEDSTESGPYRLLQNNRDADQIQTALKQLPEEQELVIRKVYMEAKSHREVAEELDLPLGTVKSRVRLAQSKLQQLVKR
jgi:RNA polymerase sigma-70 factor (ECF subfamily)